MLDASASMAFPPATQGKWTQACRVAIGLAALAHGAGDPVGVVVPGERGVSVLPPRTRRGVIAEAARMFETISPGGSASLVSVLALERPTQRIVLISDFLGDDDALLRAARERIIAGADVLAIHIVAREELDPGHAAIIAIDPEQKELERSLVAETREGYREAFAAWRDELARAWRGAGAAFLEVPSDEATDHAVRRIASPGTASSGQARGA
jgi:uncharacterized protein (DUF58 family)